MPKGEIARAARRKKSFGGCGVQRAPAPARRRTVIVREVKFGWGKGNRGSATAPHAATSQLHKVGYSVLAPGGPAAPARPGVLPTH